jgi:hypothetical protein
MASEDLHAAAVLAFLTTAGSNPFDLSKVPAIPPDYYTEVGVVRRFGGVQRYGGQRDGQLYRITERAVAKILKNAQNLRSRSDALEGAVLTIDGLTTTPIEFESADVIGPDDGYYSGLRTWSYALI